MKFDVSSPSYVSEIRLEFFQPDSLSMQTIDHKMGAMQERIKLLPESRYSTQLLKTHEMELVIEWRPRQPLPTEKKIGDK